MISVQLIEELIGDDDMQVSLSVFICSNYCS